jgi:hypothetical protein
MRDMIRSFLVQFAEHFAAEATLPRFTVADGRRDWC